jgi:penicillin-binding protein 2
MRVYRDDQKFLSFRITAMLWAIVAVFVFLAGSFWFVQGVQADKFRNLSEANAVREIVIPAKRGLIMDRNGKILADNQPAYSLAIDRIVMRPLVKANPAHKDKLEQFIANVLGVPLPEIQARYEKGKGIPASKPLPMAEDLTMAQVAAIQAEQVTFPEVVVEPVQRRNYPYNTMAAHVIGYIGEASEKDLAKNSSLKGGDLIGKKGVELQYDDLLRGVDGGQYWEYDSHGRRLEEYKSARKDPIPGSNVYLSLDFELQRRAEQYFIENQYVGAAVALDPRNGEVLAMVSSPALDPNVFSRRFTPDTWKTIVSNPFKIELNRAIQGTYSPGSVFKAVMAMAGLSEHVIDTNTQFYCGGSAVFFGRRFRCYNKNGHGDVNVSNALKVSCDVFFYNTGARLGVDKIAEYAHNLTFGEVSKIDLDGEKAGNVPSVEWAEKKQHRKWYPSETISVAIGQGPLIVTPLQVANMMAAIANGGTVFRPHVLRAVDKIDADNRITKMKVPSQVLHRVVLAKPALESVRLGLWKVVNEPGGTGGNARLPGLDVSGKTGTVQVIAQHGWVKTEGLPFKYKDHAWFASFATLQSPQMVVVVFIEHGGHGGTDAAPLAKMLYQARFKDQLASIAKLNLQDPATLQKIKEGEAPAPGEYPAPPPE